MDCSWPQHLLRRDMTEKLLDDVDVEPTLCTLYMVLVEKAQRASAPLPMSPMLRISQRQPILVDDLGVQRGASVGNTGKSSSSGQETEAGNVGLDVRAEGT